MKKSWEIILSLCLITALLLGLCILGEAEEFSGPDASSAKNNTKAVGSFTTIGDFVTFGTYSQTKEGNDTTPIEWLVLDVQGNKALLISKYGLDVQPYNTEYADVTWENCTLRKWLNETFLNNAFSQAEQEVILTTTVDNSKNQCFDWTILSGDVTTGGNNTRDKVFLLSYAEVNKYFNVTYSNLNILSRVSPTAYAISQRAGFNTGYKTLDGAAAGYWWLRSPGYFQTCVTIVYTDGSLNFDRVDGRLSVRPAIWLDLSAL